jgi:hypothetical protein
VDYRERITIDPEVRGGKPCIRGMRISVYDVLGYLASGMSQEEMLRAIEYHDRGWTCVSTWTQRPISRTSTTTELPSKKWSKRSEVRVKTVRGGMVAVSLSVGRLPAGTCELSTCRTPSWIAFS